MVAFLLSKHFRVWNSTVSYARVLSFCSFEAVIAFRLFSSSKLSTYFLPVYGHLLVFLQKINVQ